MLTQAHKYTSFPERRLTLRRLLVQGPRHSENVLRKVATFIVERIKYLNKL